MSSSEMVQRAIQSARAGRRSEARDLLLHVVEADPQNELAWMWLSGLVDSLEDRMIACENVLTINPANEKVRRYLVELQRYRESLPERKTIEEGRDLIPPPRDQNENTLSAAERLEQDGCARYVVTDVSKDGTLKGPNLDLLREVCERAKAPVVA